MKRYIHLPIVAFLLITALIFVGCGTKETLLTQPTVYALQVQTSDENKISRSQDADTGDLTQSEAQENEPKTKVVLPKIDIPDNSVLSLIPETTVGIIYCPSLLELDNRINFAATDLMLQAGESPEILAEILADAFGAGFESLDELKDIGIDLDQDFAVFFTSIDPVNLSAVVHLTNPVAMMQVIEAEAEGSIPTQYQDVTYWSTVDSGNFAILGNILVFSQTSEVCENVIDVDKEEKPSISQNPNYVSFLRNITEGKDQISAIFHLESIIASFSEESNEELQLMIDSLQSDPAMMSSVSVLEGVFTLLIDTIQELKSLSLALQIDGTDVQLSPFLKFTDDGKIQDVLKKMTPNQLASVNDLPNDGFLFGGFEGNSKLLFEWGMSWLRIFSGENLEHAEMYEELFELFNKIAQIYEYLGDEWSFYANVGDSLIPNYLTIHEVKDEQKVKTYYNDQFLDVLSNIMKIMQESMGDSSQLSMYDGAYIGNSIMHNGVEIKSFIFPNFGATLRDVSPEIAMMLPQEWHWSYAISDGLLYFAIGGQEQIKLALDSKGKIGESISENISYQKLVGKLGSDNNLLLGISPLNLAKGYMDLISKVDPNFAAELQMISGILMDIPENYSIGISGKVHDGGIGAKLLITLGDFKQLIQTVATLSNMGQLQ